MYDLTMHIEEKLRHAEHKLKMINNQIDQTIGIANCAQLNDDKASCASAVVILKELLSDITTLSTNQESFIIGREEFVKL